MLVPEYEFCFAKNLISFHVLSHFSRGFSSNQKQLKIWRNVDPSTGAVHPGLVNAQNVRAKLSRQLRIDLEDHEVVQLRAKPLELGHAELEEEDVDKIMEEIGSGDGAAEAEAAEGEEEAKCKVEIRQLGELMAKINGQDYASGWPCRPAQVCSFEEVIHCNTSYM